jgi:hypothetical protein
MFRKKIAAFLFPALILASALTAHAQSPTAQPTPDAAQQQEEKLKLETKAAALLEQVVTEAQALRLPENRIKVQIAAGDMLWDRNAGRARGLLVDAGAILSQMMIDVDKNDREDMLSLVQLRQDLVLTAGRHDAELGYQLLHSTQPPATTSTNVLNGRRMLPDQTANLEQSLLATISATDPKVAYQKAAEALDKGEYPASLFRVLAQLQAKDQEAFKKLSEKTLGRLGSDNIVSSREATNLTVSLLVGGPRPATTAATTATPVAVATNIPSTTRPGYAQILNESAYHDLMDNAVTAALTATPGAPGNTQQRGAGGPGGGVRMARGPQPNQQNPPDEAQTRQYNARVLLGSMQNLLTQIDQYLPERATALRQKLTDMGMANNNSNQNFGNQMRTAMQQGTSESLAAAASTAPPQIQPMLFQQAARKAIEEGDPDRALQIANDHLDERGKTSIMQAVDFKRMATNASPEKLNEIKSKLAALPSDSERVKYLIDLSTATGKDNPKMAQRFLEDARILVSKRAANYKDLEDQIRVADAFAAVDSKRSFELLELGINQLNELLTAATVLNGFEVDIFQDGEMSLRSGNELVGMVTRYGQELAVLAKLDFDRARLTADRFQMAEPRMNAKLVIAQTFLGTRPVAPFNNRRANNFNFNFNQ